VSSSAGPLASMTDNVDSELRSCRSCTSFAAWAGQTKAELKSSPIAAATVASLGTIATPKDCPADVETLGRSSWTLLHSIAATYPTTPSKAQQSDVAAFFGLFSRLYPCWVCAEDFQQYMTKERIRTGSRAELGDWLCNAHNEVNQKLGKPTFDCSKWEQRWRTGWKDGSCG
jgi:mitochondrial FAD-linked sulfhydryl oxidase